MGELRYSSVILDLGTEGEWSSSRPCRFAPGGHDPQCLLHRKLGGPQSRSGRCDAPKTICTCRESNLWGPARSLSLYRLPTPGGARYYHWCSGPRFYLPLKENLKSISKIQCRNGRFTQSPLPLKSEVCTNVALIKLNQNFTLMPHFQCRNQDSDFTQ
jgi:hypothetical protein